MATPAGKAGLDDRMKDAILCRIREDEIVAMCCDVINIPSPTGGELAMAEYMRAAFQQLGLTITWQQVEDTRANVIGRLEGSGNGQCLMFNGHMDTSNTGDEDFLTGIGYKPHAVVKDGMIYGLGIYNMKGALVCYVHAVKALLEAGVKLDGDIILGAVCGEIEKTQWGEFQGKEYRGYGAGTHYLVKSRRPARHVHPGRAHRHATGAGARRLHVGALRPDRQLCALGVCAGQRRPERHPPHVPRVGEVMRWIPEWQEQAQWAGRPGFVNIGCLQAGHPWRASRTPERADLFLDVRVPPTMSMTDARRAAKKLLPGDEAEASGVRPGVRDLRVCAGCDHRRESRHGEGHRTQSCSALSENRRFAIPCCGAPMRRCCRALDVPR